MPFNGENYDEIVLKNHESKIDMDFEAMGVKLSKECKLISFCPSKSHGRQGSRGPYHKHGSIKS